MEFLLWKAKESFTVKGKKIEAEFCAKEVLKAILPPIAKSGYTISDLVVRKDILIKLEQAEESVFLTKEESVFLLDHLQEYKFPVAFENLIALSHKLKEYVTNYNSGKN